MAAVAPRTAHCSTAAVSIIDPHFGDQFAWLKSVEQLWLRTSLENFWNWTSVEQISKLQQYTDTAQTLGGTVRAENFMVNPNHKQWSAVAGGVRPHHQFTRQRSRATGQLRFEIVETITTN